MGRVIITHRQKGESYESWARRERQAHSNKYYPSGGGSSKSSSSTPPKK